MHPRQAALLSEIDQIDPKINKQAGENPPWENPLTSGSKPPYLPEEDTMKIASAQSHDVFNALMSRLSRLPMGELGAIVAVLRAASIVHQTHHWQTSGGHFYSDHLIFERLYNDSIGFIDQVAERAVGSGHHVLVDAKLQADLVNGLTHVWCGAPGMPTASGLVGISLEVEKCVVACLKAARESLESKNQLSDGTDNLLQGVADKHEEFLYLLQQRAGGRTMYSYDRGE